MTRSSYGSCCRCYLLRSLSKPRDGLTDVLAVGSPQCLHAARDTLSGQDVLDTPHFVATLEGNDVVQGPVAAEGDPEVSLQVVDSLSLFLSLGVERRRRSWWRWRRWGDGAKGEVVSFTPCCANAPDQQVVLERLGLCGQVQTQKLAPNDVVKVDCVTKVAFVGHGASVNGSPVHVVCGSVSVCASLVAGYACLRRDGPWSRRLLVVLSVVELRTRNWSGIAFKEAARPVAPSFYCASRRQ